MEPGEAADIVEVAAFGVSAQVLEAYNPSYFFEEISNRHSRVFLCYEVSGDGIEKGNGAKSAYRRVLPPLCGR